jgi:hypothetical protein
MNVPMLPQETKYLPFRRYLVSWGFTFFSHYVTLKIEKLSAGSFGRGERWNRQVKM